MGDGQVVDQSFEDGELGPVEDQVDVVSDLMGPPVRTQVPQPPIRMASGTAARTSSSTTRDSSVCSDE